jgi:hypothetical protein
MWPSNSIALKEFRWLYVLWSSGQRSCLQIQRPGFDFRHYQIFWEVVGLERGLLSLVSTTEELLGRKRSGSGLEIWEYGLRDPSRWPSGTLYQQKLALSSQISGGRSVGIVRSWTQATEFIIIVCFTPYHLAFGILVARSSFLYFKHTHARAHAHAHAHTHTLYMFRLNWTSSSV